MPILSAIPWYENISRRQTRSQLKHGAGECLIFAGGKWAKVLYGKMRVLS